MKNKAFTLVELLVVVLIIGILAAIAVPQYQKAVMTANLHKGIPLVESIYQAQQVYYLANGTFATDIDDLDISIPKDCTKRETSDKFDCSWGVIGIGTNANIHYIVESSNLLYAHYYKDYTSGSLSYKVGKRYCFGKDKKARKICEDYFGGEKISSFCSDTAWCRYELK